MYRCRPRLAFDSPDGSSSSLTDTARHSVYRGYISKNGIWGTAMVLKPSANKSCAGDTGCNKRVLLGALSLAALGP